MGAVQVEPAELVERSRVLADAAARLRGGAGAAEGLRDGRELQGGLDAALADFADRWRSGHHRLAERADDLARRLARAAEVYDDVEGAVTRASAAPVGD